MADPTPQDSRRHSDRPRLHCPACSAPVILPADTCPGCGANLRTGHTPAPPAGTGSRGRLVMGVVVLLVIAGLAVLFFGWPSNRPAPAPAAETLDRTGLGESLDTARSLAEQPVGSGVDPGVILNRAHDAAGQVEEKQRQADDAAGQ